MNIALIATVSLAVAIPSPAPSSAPATDSCHGRSALLAALNRPTVGFSTCAAAFDLLHTIPNGAAAFTQGASTDTFKHIAERGVTFTSSADKGFRYFGAALGVRL